MRSEHEHPDAHINVMRVHVEGDDVMCPRQGYSGRLVALELPPSEQAERIELSLEAMSVGIGYLTNGEVLSNGRIMLTKVVDVSKDFVGPIGRLVRKPEARTVTKKKVAKKKITKAAPTEPVE